MINVKVENSYEIKYPCLMQSRSSIVLFYTRHVGTVIKSDVYDVGSHDSCWEMDNFTPFTGTIILSNGGEE